MMSRKLLILAFVGISLFFVISSARADEWAPPPAVRTVWALDMTAKAVITYEGPDWWRSEARSQASVWLTLQDSPEKLLWKGNLANIPHKVFISSHGKSLVTMDRWGAIGQDPIVFYDAQGRIVKRYRDPKKELLTKEEIPRIEQSVSSYRWSGGARAQFTVDGEHFLLWLAWGRVLVLKSDSGDQIDANYFRLESNQRNRVFETINLLKKSDNPNDRIAAARFSGWLGGETLLPIWKELLNDPYYEDGPWKKLDDPWQRFGDSYMWVCPRSYPVRKAAAEEMHIGFGQADGVIQEWIAR